MWCWRHAKSSAESKAIFSSLKMLRTSRYSRRMRDTSNNEGNHLATEKRSILVINDRMAPKTWTIGKYEAKVMYWGSPITKPLDKTPFAVARSI